MSRTRLFSSVTAVLAVGALLSGCASLQQQPERATKRDKTKKGAAIGAASGAVLGAILGEGELDEVLAGAAIGAGVGAGVRQLRDRLLAFPTLFSSQRHEAASRDEFRVQRGAGFSDQPQLLIVNRTYRNHEPASFFV